MDGIEVFLGVASNGKELKQMQSHAESGDRAILVTSRGILKISYDGKQWKDGQHKKVDLQRLFNRQSLMH